MHRALPDWLIWAFGALSYHPLQLQSPKFPLFQPSPKKPPLDLRSPPSGAWLSRLGLCQLGHSRTGFAGSAPHCSTDCCPPLAALSAPPPTLLCVPCPCPRPCSQARRVDDAWWPARQLLQPLWLSARRQQPVGSVAWRWRSPRFAAPTPAALCGAVCTSGRRSGCGGCSAGHGRRPGSRQPGPFLPLAPAAAQQCSSSGRSARRQRRG